MKKFSKEFGRSMGKASLRTIRVATLGTLGLAGMLAGTASNLIVAGCNTGIRKLDGKKTTFNKELCNVHDLRSVANHIMDGRVSITEAYDSIVPEDWKIVIEYLSHPYRKEAMNIDMARGE